MSKMRCRSVPRKPRLRSGSGPGYIADPLKPFYERVSFWFSGSKNPLGQYVNILVLESEQRQITSWLTADPQVKCVPRQGPPATRRGHLISSVAPLRLQLPDLGRRLRAWWLTLKTCLHRTSPRQRRAQTDNIK